MSIYDINYKKAGTRLQPPDKRGALMINWVAIMLIPIQWLRDLWMGSYRTGSTAPTWVAASYQKYQQVIYKQRVYESLINFNSAVPTDGSSWMLVQKDFIGVFERILYNGTKLNFEFGINKFFGTSFRQPPAVSDIYLQINPRPNDPFLIGASESTSSAVGATGSNQYITNVYNFNEFFNLNIYVPLSLYNSLDPIPANANRIIRNYADQYVYAGIVYQVFTY